MTQATRTTMKDVASELARLTAAVQENTLVLRQLHDADEAAHRDLFLHQRMMLDQTTSIQDTREVLEALRKLVIETHRGGTQIFLTDLPTTLS